MDAVERLNRRMLLAALALGALAAVVAHFYLQGVLHRALRPHTVAVLVAAKDIPARTTITADMLTTAQFVPADRPPDALSSPKAAVGATTVTGIYRGQAIVAPDLSSSATPTTLSYAIPPGERAFTLPVSPTSGVADLIQPHDLVDVLAVFHQSGSVTTVDTIEEGLKVLAVGQRIVGQSTPVPPNYGTVTLQVTPDQAAALAYAGSRGSLILTLRSVSDANYVSVAPQTGSQMPGAG